MWAALSGALLGLVAAGLVWCASVLLPEAAWSLRERLRARRRRPAPPVVPTAAVPAQRDAERPRIRLVS